jgi:hypothetical protein
VEVIGTYFQGDWPMGVIAFEMYRGSSRYAFIFVSQAPNAVHYAPIFACMATSIAM